MMRAVVSTYTARSSQSARERQLAVWGRASPFASDTRRNVMFLIHETM